MHLFFSGKPFVSVLILFSIFIAEMATDFYLLSLPDMEIAFKSTEHLLQSTLTAYLLGFSLLGILSGPLSDSKGRRPIALGGMWVFVIGSGLCCFSSHIYFLLAARFIQGLGAGVICVVLTAIVKDIYDSVKSSRLMASMSMIIALSPLLAPTLGAYISQLWGWQHEFTILFTASIVCLFLSYFIVPESLSKESFSSFSLKGLRELYIDLFKQKMPVLYSCISGISYGSLWIWIITSPFYIINNLNVPLSDYEYYAAICPVFYVIGTLANKYFLGRFGLAFLLKGGLIFMGTGCCFLLFLSQLTQVKIEIIFMALAIYSLGLAPVFSNAATLAITVASKQRGTASALLTSIELICAALCTFIGSQLNDESLLAISLGMFVCSLLCGLFLFLTTLIPTAYLLKKDA